MAVKGKNKSTEGKTYLFQMHPTLPALSMFAASSLTDTQGQLYGLLDGELVPVDVYDSHSDAYSSDIYKCLGEGKIIGRVFSDGIVSDEIKRFLKDPKNEKYRAWFESK